MRQHVWSARASISIGKALLALGVANALLLPTSIASAQDAAPASGQTDQSVSGARARLSDPPKVAAPEVPGPVEDGLKPLDADKQMASTPPIGDPGIVGGTAASTGAYPYFVSLQWAAGGGTPYNKHFCGGTLISSTWVLTAGHCIRNSFHSGDLLPSEVDLLIGNTLLTDTSQGETRNAAQILVHPSYTTAGGAPNFDVALIQLDAPSTFRWARMADGGDPFGVGQSVRAVGHGDTFQGSGAAANELRQVDLPVQSDASMASAYGGSFVGANMIGAGPLAGGQDTCQGDSGGPLFVTGFQPALVGDTSWGSGCAQPNFPGVYGESWGGVMRTFVDSNVPRPSNNNFAGSAIGGASGFLTSSNTDATAQVGEPSVASLSASTSVWYSWSAPASGPTIFNTRNSTFDTTLGVYTGASVNALAAVATNDDYITLQSRVSFNAVSGTTYRIQVGGFSAAHGTFNLQWGLNGPANDEFSAAAALVGPTGKAFGSNVAATGEPLEPAHITEPNSSVWYSWIAPESGPAVMNTKDSTFDTVLGVYTGGSVGSLTQVAINDDSFSLQSKVTFNAIAGTTYRIVVDGYSLGQGSITLQWSVNRPSYDDFATPRVTAGFQGFTSGSTIRSTGEPGSPEFHGGAYSDNSSWFSWTPTLSAPSTVRLRGIGGGLFPGIEVYTGSSLTGLTSVGSGGTQAFFNAVGGTNYRIAVDGNGGSTGTFVLEWMFGKCNGVDATIFGSGGPITGTAGDDVIVGTMSNDIIDGLGGNDTICSLDGDDTVNGGDGNDRIYGGFGNDIIDGGLGNDVVRGDDGNDIFKEGGVSNGADYIDGSAGVDLVRYDSRTAAVDVSLDSAIGDGAAGENDNVLATVENVWGSTAGDTITGSASNDQLLGKGGNDTLVGGAGVDDVQGGDGNDSLNVADGAPGDSADGGNGTDTASSDVGDTVTNVP